MGRGGVFNVEHDVSTLDGIKKVLDKIPTEAENKEAQRKADEIYKAKQRAKYA